MQGGTRRDREAATSFVGLCIIKSADGLWYCYAVIVIAIVTGVVVNYFLKLSKLKNKDSLDAVVDKLEHLPELSKEELAEISEKVKRLRKED